MVKAIRHPRTEPRCILVVDDDQDVLRYLASALRKAAHEVTTATSGEEALATLQTRSYDAVLLDLQMPKPDGFEVMESIRDAGGSLRIVIVITGYASTENRCRIAALGPRGVLAKPLHTADLLAMLAEILSESAASPSPLVGASAAIEEVRQQIREVAPSGVSVLIEGETGTGKELVAREIHVHSGRSGPFVACSCAAWAEGVVASELFGHVRGAFTGADRDHKGRFELANGGTLFLDEVADIDEKTQSRLLRVLQEGEFEPVGSSASRKADVRVVAATNRDLRAAVEQGRFREDLYYRIRGSRIVTPPLRERTEDLPALCAHVLGRVAGARQVKVTAEAMEVLRDYRWPGNVRELEAVLSRALLRSPEDQTGEDQIGAEHLDIPEEGPGPRGAVVDQKTYVIDESDLRAASASRLRDAVHRTGPGSSRRQRVTDGEGDRHRAADAGREDLGTVDRRGSVPTAVRGRETEFGRPVTGARPAVAPSARQTAAWAEIRRRETTEGGPVTSGGHEGPGARVSAEFSRAFHGRTSQRVDAKQTAREWVVRW